MSASAPAILAPEHEPEGGRQVWLRKVFLSVTGQALLSALNLGIGLIFVRLASKPEYALYAQVSAIVLLLSGAVGATIGSPLMSLYPQTAEQARPALVTTAFRLVLLLSGIASLLACAAVYFIPSLLTTSNPSIPLVVMLAIAIVVAGLRDFWRNVLFLKLRVADCLRLDATYACACLCAIAVMVLVQSPTAIGILAITSIFGLLGLIPWLPAKNLLAPLGQKNLAQTWARIGPLARWSLPALLVTFVSSGFPLLTTHVVGTDATAEIIAARLFIAPLGPLFISWSNVFRPKIGLLLAENSIARVRQLVVLSIFLMAAGILAYLGLVLVSYATLEEYVLGPSYRHLQFDIAWWGVGALIAGLTGIGTAVLMAQGKLQTCFWSACASNFASVPLLLVLGAGYGKPGVLAAMALGNAISAVWTFVAVFGSLAPDQKKTKE